MIIGGNGDSIYTRLMTAVGRADMGADNPRYQSNTDRCQHEKEIYEVCRSYTLCFLPEHLATCLLNGCPYRHLSLHSSSCTATFLSKMHTRQS